MSGRDIIVVGASAGGVEALTELVRGLPPDLPAAVLIVLHIPPYRPSRLPAILNGCGALPAGHASHGEAIRHGRIYVAPPDRHMLVRDGAIALSQGPRENGTRPAIDPLFRSAARAYDSRVVGVVLSGTLGDGSAGLMAIKARGGVAIAQDPDEALFPGMPRTAIRYASPDDVLPVARISPLLVRLASEPVAARGASAVPMDPEQAPEAIRRDLAAQAAGRRRGETALYCCPECGGVLWQLSDGQVTHFQCHVGHTYSPEHLLVKKSEDLEAALWSCVRSLTEKAILTRQLATRARESGDETTAARIQEQAELDEKHVRIIRESLLEAIPNPTSQLIEILQALEPARGPEGPAQAPADPVG